MRLEIHRTELPDFAPIVDPRQKSTCLLLLAHLEPVFDQDYSRVNESLLNGRTIFQEVSRLLFGTEVHHALDQRAVVPTAVKEDDFSRCREMRDVPLNIYLRFFRVRSEQAARQL